MSPAPSTKSNSFIGFEIELESAWHLESVNDDFR